MPFQLIVVVVIVVVVVVVAAAFRALYTPISAPHLHIWEAASTRRRLNFCIWLLCLSFEVFTVVLLLFACLSGGNPKKLMLKFCFWGCSLSNSTILPKNLSTTFSLNFKKREISVYSHTLPLRLEFRSDLMHSFANNNLLK